MAAGVTEVAVFAASTETFSRKNVNQGIDESLGGYKQVCDRAIAAGLRVRGYLSTAFGCPYEGAVAPGVVADLTARLVELGVFEVAVSDTIGIAHPGQVPRVLERVLERTKVEQVALHFHDTRGMALANVLAALPLRHRDLRCVRGRARRLPVRAGGRRQPGDRRPDLHVGWIGGRHRCVAAGR